MVRCRPCGEARFDPSLASWIVTPAGPYREPAPGATLSPHQSPAEGDACIRAKVGAKRRRTALDYIVHISRSADNVATNTVQADSDAQAFDLAIEWAASLLLAPDDDVVLAIQLRSGAFKTFVRKDF